MVEPAHKKETGRKGNVYVLIFNIYLLDNSGYFKSAILKSIFGRGVMTTAKSNASPCMGFCFPFHVHLGSTNEATLNFNLIPIIIYCTRNDLSVRWALAEIVPDFWHHAGLDQWANLSLAPASRTQMLLLHLTKKSYISCVKRLTPHQKADAVCSGYQDAAQVGYNSTRKCQCHSVFLHNEVMWTLWMYICYTHTFMSLMPSLLWKCFPTSQPNHTA